MSALLTQRDMDIMEFETTEEAKAFIEEFMREWYGDRMPGQEQPQPQGGNYA